MKSFPMMRHPAMLFSIFCVYLCAVAALTSALAEPQKRIVIAGGDLTEIAFILGAGDQIVGVDATSTHPPAATERAQIGYVRRLSAEGVLSLSPDLVIAAHDAGPDTALSQISAAGVQVARAPAADKVSEIAEKIRFVGDALARKEEAEALASSFTSDLSAVSEKVARLARKPNVLFILSLERGTPMVAGTGTSADTIIAEAGGVNAAIGFEGYKPMAREALIEAAPDVILMMDQHAERFGGLDDILDRPEIALTPAGQNRRAVSIEGMLLLGFGPRTPEAIAMLARALHPDDAERVGF